MPRNSQFYKHSSDSDGGGLSYVLKKQQKHYTGPLGCACSGHTAVRGQVTGWSSVGRRLCVVRCAGCLESGSELGSLGKILEVDLGSNGLFPQRLGSHSACQEQADRTKI